MNPTLPHAASRLLIKRHNHPVAAVVPMDDLRLRELLDDMLGVEGRRSTWSDIAQMSRFPWGARPVTAELALLFGRALDQSPQYWLNLQGEYDLKTAAVSIGPRLRAVHSVIHA